MGFKLIIRYVLHYQKYMKRDTNEYRHLFIMDKYAPQVMKILSILNENPTGMTIREISDSLGANRISTAKYLDILHIQGSVDIRQRGSAKFFFPSHRVPFTSIKKFVKDWYIFFDNGGYISDIHPELAYSINIPLDQLVGKRISVIPVSELQETQLKDELKQVIRGHDIPERDISLTIIGAKILFHVSFVSVIFPNSKPGGGMILERLPEHESDNSAPPIEIPGAYIAYISPEGRILTANDTCISALGRPRNDVIGTLFTSFIPKTDWPSLDENTKTLSPEHPFVTFESRLIRNSGEIIWIRSLNRAHYSESGTLMGYYSLNIDITARKRKEEQVRKERDDLMRTASDLANKLRYSSRQIQWERTRWEQNENLFRLTQFSLDMCPDLILWLSPDGKVHQANPAVMDLLGYSIPMMQSLSWHDFSIPSEDTRWEEIWSKVKREMQYVHTMQVSRANGTKIDVEIHFRYLHYDSREHCICYVKDISQRMQIAHNLSAKEEQLGGILAGIPDAIFVLDTDKRVIIWNRAMEELTGVTAKDILGKGNGEHAASIYRKPSGMLIDLIFEDNPEIRKKYPYINRCGDSLFSEKFFPKFRGGDDRSFRFSAFPIRGKNGEMIGAFEVIQDFSLMDTLDLRKIRKMQQPVKCGEPANNNAIG